MSTDSDEPRDARKPKDPMTKDSPRSDELQYTGERFHPEILGEIRQEHMHRYAWAAPLVAGKDVVDVASGEGFGSHVLAAGARSVVGIDIAEDAVRHARAKYQKPNLSFVCGDAGHLPLPDNSADIVVSFETIEHVDDQYEMIADLRRILRPSGLLVISSPNRVIYSDRQSYKNPYHVKELDKQQFIEALKSEFGYVKLFGQRVSVASSILPVEKQSASRADVLIDDGQVQSAAFELPSTMYYVALAAASQELVPPLDSSFLLSGNYDVYWSMRETLERQDAELRRLENERRVFSDYILELSVRAGDLATIAASGLFDSREYAARAGLSSDNVSLGVLHYLEIGEREGLAPSDQFDPIFYRNHYPDLADLQTNLLLHYIRAGRFEGRAPRAS